MGTFELPVGAGWHKGREGAVALLLPMAAGTFFLSVWGEDRIQIACVFLGSTCPQLRLDSDFLWDPDMVERSWFMQRSLCPRLPAIVTML